MPHHRYSSLLSQSLGKHGYEVLAFPPVKTQNVTYTAVYAAPQRSGGERSRDVTSVEFQGSTSGHAIYVRLGHCLPTTHCSDAHRILNVIFKTLWKIYISEPKLLWIWFWTKTSCYNTRNQGRRQHAWHSKFCWDGTMYTNHENSRLPI
jgi:hypothetical protein